MLSLPEALAAGPVVLDGGLSTELERQGHDLTSSLWSARLLADDPAAIIGVHRAFLRAGAQVLTTASYQASELGFTRAGFPPGTARELTAVSVRLAREAISLEGAPRASVDLDGVNLDGAGAWVAGSAGPYGAMLGDGSEYTGDYGPGVGIAELRDYHRDQLRTLVDAGADVLACETIPTLAETHALVAELETLGHPAWISLTTATGPDGSVLTRRGEPAEEAFAAARAASCVIAVGVNCTDPRGAAAAVRVAAESSGKPVVVYPNSGEAWDAAGRFWTATPASGAVSLSDRPLVDWADDVLDGGARLVGGCCRVGPGQIRKLADHVAQPRLR